MSIGERVISDFLNEEARGLLNPPSVGNSVERLVDTNTLEEYGVPDLADNGYNCIRFLANCNGGYVYLARSKKGRKEHVAIKRYTVDDLGEYDLIAKEAANMRIFSHPKLLELEACFVCDEFIYSVAPAMNLGSLHDIVANYRNWGIGEKTAASIFSQVVEGLLYIHKKRYIHRDIRPSHILMDSRGNVKLSGFRFMIELNHRLDCVFDFDTHLQSQIYYFAPEVLAQNMHGYGTKSDIYMLGMTMCEALNGVIPFVETEPLEMLHRKLNGQLPRPVDATSLEDDRIQGFDISGRPQVHMTRQFTLELHDFIANCLLYDPESRPTAKQLKDSAWLGLKSYKNITADEVLADMMVSERDYQFTFWNPNKDSDHLVDEPNKEPVIKTEKLEPYNITFDYSSLETA